MKKSEAGFSVIMIVLIVLVLGVCGFAFWKITQTNKTAPKASINSFDECVAAGNPVMDSYPEQCAADGKTFSNPNQKVEEIPYGDDGLPAEDETDNWLSYTSSKKTYTVRVPDGWKLLNITDTEHLFGGKFEKLDYKSGTKASVAVQEGGWDGASTFSLIVPSEGQDEIVKEGTKTGTFTTSQGFKAEKYEYTQTTEPDGIGFAKGEKAVTYYFAKDGKYIYAQHVYGNGVDSQTEIVEKMLKTLVIN